MDSLANKLQKTTHLSGLGHKLKRFGLLNADDWAQLAVQRGCSHYRIPGIEKVQDPGTTCLPNHELAIALLLNSNRYVPRFIRIAAQLLSVEASANRIIHLARL